MEKNLNHQDCSVAEFVIHNAQQALLVPPAETSKSSLARPENEALSTSQGHMTQGCSAFHHRRVRQPAVQKERSQVTGQKA